MPRSDAEEKAYQAGETFGIRKREARDYAEDAARQLDKIRQAIRDAGRALDRREVGAARWQLGRIEQAVQQAESAIIETVVTLNKDDGRS